MYDGYNIFVTYLLFTYWLCTLKKMDSKKIFGLVLRKKTDLVNVTGKSVFESSSDEEVAEKGKFPKVLPSSSKSRVKVDHVEDSSIYEYDNIFEEMKANQVKESAVKKKNSRYIETLLKAADKRKKEHERRVEKKIHLDREKEGDKFKDKEAFVTSTYKKKMQEMEDEEERERRENQINDMMDVTKQKDLSGFYRHFLKQTVGEEKVPIFGDRHAIKSTPIKQEKQSIKKNIEADGTALISITVDSVGEKQTEVNDCRLTIKKEPMEHEGTTCKNIEEDEIKLKPIENDDTVDDGKDEIDNCDADTNSSSDSEKSLSDVDQENECPKDFCSKSHGKQKYTDVEEIHKHKDLSEYNEISEPETISVVKTLNDIFAKRTVGIIFDEAQARYFERRATRKAI